MCQRQKILKTAGTRKRESAAADTYILYTLYGFHDITTSVIERVFRVTKGNDNNMTEGKKIKIALYFNS